MLVSWMRVTLPAKGSVAPFSRLLPAATRRGFASAPKGMPVVDAAAFHRDGVGIVRNFASPEHCKAMIARMGELVNAWDPHKISTFATDAKQIDSQGNDDYFLDSSNQIHFFLEPHAVDEKTQQLKPGYKKHSSLNKVGHGLHEADPVFREYSTSKRVKYVTEQLGWVDPVLPQSMYIFKESFVGGEVTSHQDSTFLFTTPRQTCLGLWLALMDSTMENGCIWARPGSHKEPCRRHFARNPAYFAGDHTQTKMLFEDCTEGGLPKSDAPWEGTIPKFPGATAEESVRKVGFVPFPCKAGDLVLIHGLVDHLSLDNTSDKSRHTFQLHLVEGPSQGITWHPRNWLQYPKGHEFPKLGTGH